MPNKHTSHFAIKIAGTNAPEEMYDSLEEITVDSRLNLPAMFTLRLHDATLKWVDEDSILKIGNEIEISAAVDEDASSELSVSGNIVLFKGEITAIEPSFASTGNTKVVVRGYDKMHRLHRGRKIRTFLNIKDSDLVNQFASEAGLSTGTIDTTSQQFEFLLQNNQTNMEFLMARAEKIGYQLFMSDGKLNYKKGDSFTSGETISLKFLESLTRFEPRWTASHQADKVTVRGWNPKQKQEIVGTATPISALNQGGMSETGGDMAKTAFSPAEEIVTDLPVVDQSEATNIAKGLLNQINRDFVQAEGECFGHPKIKAGCKVNITGVGTRFSGNYMVSSATHIYNAQGYSTHIGISGQRTDTLSSILQEGAASQYNQMTGIVTGVVTNLNDPDNVGRVKVKYAWLGNIESNWVRIASPMAGKERGMMFMPEVNDEVALAFQHGDPNYPIMIGALWNGVDKPPNPNSTVVQGGKAVLRVIKSTSGHQIILDDTDGSEKIVIRDKTNNNEILIDTKTNTITIKSDKDLKIVTKGQTNIDATGKVTLSSKDDLSIECMNFKVAAQTNVDIKGNAGVNIANAAAKIALSGPSVNINNGALEVT